MRKWNRINKTDRRKLDKGARLIIPGFMGIKSEVPKRVKWVIST